MRKKIKKANKKLNISVLIISITFFVLIFASFFLVPIPHKEMESYEVNEIYYVEECVTNTVKLNADGINRVIDSIIENDATKLVKTCRMVPKYKVVTKDREVTKKDTLFVLFSQKYLSI